ncbi:MAG: hypothetical protein QXY49_03665 [Thermofilaceae archaeon]
MDTGKLYEALLKYYASSTFWGDPREKLEKDISKLVASGLSRDEALKRLFEEKVGDYKVLEEKKLVSENSLNDAQLVYKGEKYGILYVEMDPFYDNLPKLGKLLESVEELYGEVVAVIPNMGFVTASLILGTSFQGVKGVAVIFKLQREKTTAEQTSQSSRG